MESGFTFGGKPYNAIGSNDANNVFDSTNVVANNDGSVLERLEYVTTVLAGIEPVTFTPSSAPTVDEDGGRVAVGVTIVDANTGPIASGSIDITGITYELARSTAGGAFSTAGVTQPAGATKATGLVELEFDFTAAEWAVGDKYRLKLGGVTATVGATTYYMGTLTWVGEVVEDLDVKTAVDDIDTDLGEPNAAAVDPTGASGALHAKLRGLARDLIVEEATVNDASPGVTDNETTLTSAVDGFYADAMIKFTSGSLAGQERRILRYIGSTKRVDVDVPWTSAPANGDAFVVYAASASGRITVGEADSGSTTTMVDSERTEAAADYWKGQELRFLSGTNKGLARVITAFDAGTDTITVSPAFPNAIASGHHYIIEPAGFAAPTTDATGSATVNETIGNKGDAGSAAATASLVALSRLLVDTYAATTGTADSGTTTTMVDTERTEAAASDLEGQMLVFTSGNNDRVGRIIVDFDPATDTLTVAPAFADAIAAGDKYVIIPADFANALDLALSATGVSIATDSLADQLYTASGFQLRKSIVVASGTTDGAGTVTTVADTTRAEANNYWTGMRVLMLTGASAGQVRSIDTSTQSVSLHVNPPFSNATGNGSKYVILAADDNATSANNSLSYLWKMVIGHKEDTALGVASTSGSLAAYSKHMVDAIGADNNNNAFASTNVAANRDGSLMERSESVIQAVGAWTTNTTATVTCATAAETTLFEVTSITTPTQVAGTLNLKNITVDATLNVYEHVYTGAGYEYQKVADAKTFTAAGTVDAVRVEFTAQRDYKVTITTGAEGANRDVYVSHCRRVTG